MTENAKYIPILQFEKWTTKFNIYNQEIVISNDYFVRRNSSGWCKTNLQDGILELITGGWNNDWACDES